MTGGAVPPGVDPRQSRRRFTAAAVIGSLVAAVPFLWFLWAPWESPNFLRQSELQDNFYDIQTRAMFHGHLWLANGAIGIEAFVHNGRQYTYFGLFPSLLRVPVLAFTTSLDGRLTAPSMLLAWMLTALFASLLLWRVRLMIRGPAAMGRIEVVSSGVLMAAITGGSVLLFLAATPYVFNEDLAWSICLTVGSIFALLGVLERPSWGRVVASGLLMLGANLDRLTTGWACVLGGVLIAAWFGLGRDGQEHRRWCVPVLVSALVPLVVGCAVNYAKFGVPFGLPVTDQVFTKVNAYRRQFLAANHQSEVGTAFIPSDLLAYFRPDGIRLSSIFPFITLPAKPAAAVSGVLFDKRYRTASLPDSMPLLTLLSLWGLVIAFRPRPVGRVAPIRLLLLATASAGAALMLWGYIAPRYLADFIPFLVLAGAVGFVDIWRRMDGRSRPARLGVSAVIVVLALFSIAANIGIAITPNEEWNTPQVLRYVETQKSVGDTLGASLQGRVIRGSTLPPWGPADQLFIVGHCDGLYISNGEDYSTVPAQQYQRTTWMTVELGHALEHTFRVTVERPVPGAPEALTLVTVGSSSVTVTALAAPHGQLRLTFGLTSGRRGTYGAQFEVAPGTTHQVVVITDTNKHALQVSADGTPHLSTVMNAEGPVVVPAGSQESTGSPPALSVEDITASTPSPTLCLSLLHR